MIKVLAAAWTTMMIPVSALAGNSTDSTMNPERRLRYENGSAAATRRWQARCRTELYRLMMGGGKPDRIPLKVEVVRRIDSPRTSYTLEELTLQSLPDRRAHLWVAAPKGDTSRRPVVLAIHGHGGTGEQIVRGQSLYWYGKALVEMGYVVIAPDVGSHDLQHPNWTLMGERTWDCIRAIDYAVSRPDVDPNRIAVCGLSLGGETTMYVAALDTRLKVVDSSGWLTTVANMRNGHCECYDFPGLGENFDFSDIFGCIAPRSLVCEIGRQERAPGGFPLEIAQPAFEEIRKIYAALDASDRVRLTVHSGGHVFVGSDYWPELRAFAGGQQPWTIEKGVIREADRRAEVYGRAMNGASGVLEGWWAARDPQTSMPPRQIREPVWAPNDNGADLVPFLWLTDYYTSQSRKSEMLTLLKTEAALTNREGPLPDWFSLTSHNWVHRTPDLRRMIFGAAEYCKDGLMPMTEAMGRGPWFDRMETLISGIIERLPISTDFGRLPADDTEVNGDLLQVLGRLYAMTGKEPYYKLMRSIADAYCFEVIPKNNGIPAHRWDFTKHTPINDVFNLNDHGNEIILGLVEAYIATKGREPEQAARYQEALLAMFRRLLAACRNEDGLWRGQVVASTGQVRVADPPDTWGYALCALAAFADAADRPELLREVQSAIKALDKPRYLYWAGGADSYADSIEGALLLLSRYPSPVIERWLQIVTPIFLSFQQPTGIVEGWYGDGNFARTCLLLAMYSAQGLTVSPYVDGIRIGAVQTDGALEARLTSPTDWTGRLHCDTPRHRAILGLSTDYLRLNHWPEWWTLTRDARYSVRIDTVSKTISGEELESGIPITLRAGQPVTVRIIRL